MTLVSVVLVLALAGVALVLALIVLRTWRSARDRRLREVAERLRPAAIELVDTPDAEPPALTGTEARVFAELLAHYSRMLRGDDDERIGAYFEASGAVDQLRHRLRSRRLRRRVGAAFGAGGHGLGAGDPGSAARTRRPQRRRPGRGDQEPRSAGRHRCGRAPHRRLRRAAGAAIGHRCGAARDRPRRGAPPAGPARPPGPALPRPRRRPRRAARLGRRRRRAPAPAARRLLGGPRRRGRRAGAARRR